MTVEQPAIAGSDLRALLDSELPNAALVVVGGRPQIVAGTATDSEGLEVVSRAQFLDRSGRTTFTSDELDHYAATLSTVVENLGG